MTLGVSQCDTFSSNGLFLTGFPISLTTPGAGLTSGRRCVLPHEPLRPGNKRRRKLTSPTDSNLHLELVELLAESLVLEAEEVAGVKGVDRRLPVSVDVLDALGLFLGGKSLERLESGTPSRIERQKALVIGGEFGLEVGNGGHFELGIGCYADDSTIF